VQIKIESVSLGEVVVLQPEVFEDARRFFLEAFRADEFRAHGLPDTFVQDNHSGSRRGVLRGLHFQWDPPMGKLMRVTRGTAVAVDIRKGSPTLGRWAGLEASAENRKQMWAPARFARGFCVLSEVAEIQYKCTGLYNPKGESGILWRDPEIGIAGRSPIRPCRTRTEPPSPWRTGWPAQTPANSRTWNRLEPADRIPPGPIEVRVAEDA
jgi:dTDP-4-dehydrorhamnose 3,5-epimerase